MKSKDSHPADESLRFAEINHYFHLYRALMGMLFAVLIYSHRSSDRDSFVGVLRTSTKTVLKRIAASFKKGCSKLYLPIKPYPK